MTPRVTRSIELRERDVAGDGSLEFAGPSVTRCRQPGASNGDEQPSRAGNLGDEAGEDGAVVVTPVVELHDERVIDEFAAERVEDRANFGGRERAGELDG